MTSAVVETSSTITPPSTFLSITYSLVDDHSTDEIISWGKDGSSFIVWDPSEFSKTLLPKFFKHNSFCNFVVQLINYQFKKIVHDRWEFLNENFQRGNKDLLCQISSLKPVNMDPAADPTTSTEEEEEEEGGISAEYWKKNSELILEHERLRVLKNKLTMELSLLRK